MLEWISTVNRGTLLGYYCLTYLRAGGFSGHQYDLTPHERQLNDFLSLAKGLGH